MVSDTIILRPDSRIVGEGYSILRMLPNSFGANKPLLSAPASTSATGGVQLADISLWNADCGNDNGIMLAWEVRFQWKNPDFLLRNPDFLLKNIDFYNKTGWAGVLGA